MYRHDKTLLRNCAVIFLLIITSRLLLFFPHDDSMLQVTISLLRSFIYLGLFTFWWVSLRHRIIQSPIRKYLCWVAALIVVWIALRTIKYLVFGYTNDLNRHLWYLLYLPIIFIPLTGLFAAVCLGKPDDYRLPVRLRLLYAPAGLLLATVLTNDLHQFAFVFPAGIAKYRDEYTHNIVYYIVFVWMLACTAVSLAILIKKNLSVANRKMMWLPFAALGVGLAYSLLYLVRIDIVHILCGDFSVMLCLVTAAIWESCIQCGLIQSNTRYAGLFVAATIAAEIVDKNYVVRYAADAARDLSAETMKRAEDGPVQLDEDTRLQSAAIHGGRVLWLEDVSAVNRLLSRLKEAGERLAGESDLLRAELDVRERMARVDEQNRLYDRISGDISPQLEKLEALLPSAGSDGPGRRVLAQICVLSAYVKRRSNLLIISEEGNTLSSEELGHCIRESLDSIRACGAMCSFSCRCRGELSWERTAALYDVFEAAAESFIASVSALLVNLEAHDGGAEMKLELACGASCVPKEVEQKLEVIRSAGGSAVCEASYDGAIRLHACFPKGGAGQ